MRSSSARGRGRGCSPDRFALFRTCLAIVLVLAAAAAQAQVTLTRGTNFSIDAAPDGRIAFDLLGEIRIIPPGGGVAQPITGAPSAASRPRWSADGSAYSLSYFPWFFAFKFQRRIYHDDCGDFSFFIFYELSYAFSRFSHVSSWTFSLKNVGCSTVYGYLGCNHIFSYFSRFMSMH